MREGFLFDWFNIQANLSAVCILEDKFDKTVTKKLCLTMLSYCENVHVHFLNKYLALGHF